MHLQKLCEIFEGVDISVYAKKIRQFANTIEAWNGSELIGLCACYMNDYKNLCGYITHIALDKQCRGEGIGTLLLLETKQLLKERGFHKIKLEVHKQNSFAFHFYCQRGFVIKEDRLNKYLMEADI